MFSSLSSDKSMSRRNSSTRLSQQTLQDIDARAHLQASSRSSTSRYIETNTVTQAVNFDNITRPLVISSENCPAEVDKVVVVQESTPVNGQSRQGKMYFRLRVTKRGKYSLWSMLRGSEFFVSLDLRTGDFPATMNGEARPRKGTVWHVPTSNGWGWRKFWQPFKLEIGDYDLVIACGEAHAGIAFIWLGDGPFDPWSTTEKEAEVETPVTPSPRLEIVIPKKKSTKVKPKVKAKVKREMSKGKYATHSKDKKVRRESSTASIKEANAGTSKEASAVALPSASDPRKYETAQNSNGDEPQLMRMPTYNGLDPEDEHLSKEEALRLREQERQRDEWIRSVLERKKTVLETAQFIPLFGKEADRLRDKYNAKRRVLSYFDAKPEDRRVHKLFEAYAEHKRDIEKALSMPVPKLHESKSFFASKTYVY